MTTSESSPFDVEQLAQLANQFFRELQPGASAFPSSAGLPLKELPSAVALPSTAALPSAAALPTAAALPSLSALPFSRDVEPLGISALPLSQLQALGLQRSPLVVSLPKNQAAVAQERLPVAEGALKTLGALSAESDQGSVQLGSAVGQNLDPKLQSAALPQRAPGFGGASLPTVATRPGGPSAASQLGGSSAQGNPLDAGGVNLEALLQLPHSAAFGLPPLQEVSVLSSELLGNCGEASYYFIEPGEQTSASEQGGRAPAAHAWGHGPGFDLRKVRADFPILAERVQGGRPLIWLDNGATTQKPQAVIDRLSHFYAHENSNIHRAAHELAARSTDAYEHARDLVRDFVGAGSSEEIVFLRGTTEAINLVAQSWGRKNIGPGDEIVVTHLEHHANIVPWQLLAEEKGARLRVIPVDDSGQVILSEAKHIIGPKTKLLSTTRVSNALGTVVPVAELAALAHAVGAKVLVDGAQSVSHLPTDVNALGADWFVFSGHKIFAPTGIGVLYGRKEVLETMPPWQGGGNMIQDVSFERSIFQAPPARFEAGTGNIADAVGLGAALEYVNQVGLHNINAWEHELLAYGTSLLERISGLRIIGNAKDKTSVLSFVINGHSTEEIGQVLNKAGIAVRGGHHCAQPILRRFGLESTVRATLAFYNSKDDLDALAGTLSRLAAGRN